MLAYYAAADVAIIGGSFLPFGGQNLIEACALGRPVIVGPHTYNFDEAARGAIAAGAALRVADAVQALAEAKRLTADAALRELREETGVAASAGDVLGVLDDYATRSGYLITPVVVWGGPVSPAMSGPASEVAEIHVIPLADLDVAPRLRRIPQSPSPVIQLPFLGGYLHAPTAAIVFQFCQVALHGRATRVSHFEQPVFAWR